MMAVDGVHEAATVVSCTAPVAPRREWSLEPDGSDGGRWRLVLRAARSQDGGAATIAGAAADQPPSAPSPTRLADAAAAPRGSEWTVGVGQAWSIDLFQSTGGRRYLTQTIAWGRDLTVDAAPGFLRGRLVWAVEAAPLYWQTAPSSTVGVGILPLLWRWRFVPRGRATPQAELAFGGLFTRDPVPEGTVRTNFLSHGAFGIEWALPAPVRLITAYRFQHISNGNQQGANPGVNAHVLWVGIGLRSPR